MSTLITFWKPQVEREFVFRQFIFSSSWGPKVQENSNKKVACYANKLQMASTNAFNWVLIQCITEPISAWKFPCKLPKNSCVLKWSVQFNGCYRCQVPKFSQNLSLLLTLSFCQLNMIAKASFVRPTFASSLTDVFSFVLCCFRRFELVHGVFCGSCLLIASRITGIYNTKNAW